MFCEQCHKLLTPGKNHNCIVQENKEKRILETILKRFKKSPKLADIIELTKEPGEDSIDWVIRYIRRTQDISYITVTCQKGKKGKAHISLIDYLGKSFSYEKVFCAANCIHCKFKVHGDYSIFLDYYYKFGAKSDRLDRYILILPDQILSPIE